MNSGRCGRRRFSGPSPSNASGCELLMNAKVAWCNTSGKTIAMPVEQHNVQIRRRPPPLVNYITVAEHVWAFVLNWLKRLPAIREWMRTRRCQGAGACFRG